MGHYRTSDRERRRNNVPKSSKNRPLFALQDFSLVLCLKCIVREPSPPGSTAPGLTLATILGERLNVSGCVCHPTQVSHPSPGWIGSLGLSNYARSCRGDSCSCTLSLTMHPDQSVPRSCGSSTCEGNDQCQQCTSNSLAFHTCPPTRSHKDAAIRSQSSHSADLGFESITAPGSAFRYSVCTGRESP
jgi:hypothetical protein